MEKPRNFVKKHMDILCKPSRMKDRKKEAKRENYYDDAEKHAQRKQRAAYKRNSGWDESDEE